LIANLSVDIEQLEEDELDKLINLFKKKTNGGNMGRPRKNELINTAAIVPVNIDLPIEKIRLNEAQMQTLRFAEGRISATAARLQRIDKEITQIKSKINESDEARQLKRLKSERKLLQKLQVEATSTYNGALEMALAEVEGKTLSEKLRRLSDGS
jgi:hypothetical protein